MIKRGIGLLLALLCIPGLNGLGVHVCGEEIKGFLVVYGAWAFAPVAVLQARVRFGRLLSKRRGRC